MLHIDDAEVPEAQPGQHLRVALWLALVGAIAVVIGSLGPWMTVHVGSASTASSGVEGDGKLTVILGIIAAILILSRAVGRGSKSSTFVAFICLVAACYIGAADWDSLASVSAALEAIDTLYEELPGDRPGRPVGVISKIQAGWGLQAVTIGAAISAIALIAHWLFDARRR